MTRLLISLTEMNHSWQGESSPLSVILTKLEQNPFAPFEQMELDDEQLPYDRQEALRVLGRGQSPSAEFLAKRPFSLTSRINRSPNINSLRLEPDTNYLAQLNPPVIINYSVQLADLLPNFGRCRISVSSLVSVPAVSSLPALPDCFALAIGWYHLISSRSYELYYSQQDLLNAPAYKVQKLDNGWVEMYVYPNPLDYDKPENLQRLTETANYLNACRRDKDKLVR